MESALINVARNIGGSRGVALAQTVLAQRQQFHQSRLIEHAAPSDIGYQQTIETMTRFFQATRTGLTTPDYESGVRSPNLFGRAI